MPPFEIPPPNELARSSPLALALWQRCQEALERAVDGGDDPSRPRPVSHRISLPSPEAAALFADLAQVREFECRVETHDDGTATVTAVRVDAIGLPHIHNVVMELSEFAAPYDGDHDGWDALSAP